LKFYFHDPKEKLVDIIVYDENKKKLNSSWAKINYGITISLHSKPTTKLLLEVLIENEEACRDFPFQVKEIKLPE